MKNNFLTMNNVRSKTRPYENWNVNELENALWLLINKMSIPGGYTDIEMIKMELKIRELSNPSY